MRECESLVNSLFNLQDTASFFPANLPGPAYHFPLSQVYHGVIGGPR
jgi:hypothetical protein